MGTKLDLLPQGRSVSAVNYRQENSHEDVPGPEHIMRLELETIKADGVFVREVQQVAVEQIQKAQTIIADTIGKDATMQKGLSQLLQ